MHLPVKSFAILFLPVLASCSPDDAIPIATREYWMRRAIDALSELTSTPCPFEAFGAAIVNHTDVTNSDHGELICLGVNSIMRYGNPTLHGMNRNLSSRGLMFGFILIP
jgi:hypothetical protein